MLLSFGVDLCSTVKLCLLISGAAMTKSNDECLHKQISTDTFQLGKVEDK